MIGACHYHAVRPDCGGCNQIWGASRHGVVMTAVRINPDHPVPGSAIQQQVSVGGGHDVAVTYRQNGAFPHCSFREAQLIHVAIPVGNIYGALDLTGRRDSDWPYPFKAGSREEIS